jgi:uncharacterized membrane protein YraQ (UPF0718 family)
MNRGFAFGVGTLVWLLGYTEALYLIHNATDGIRLSQLPIFLVFAALGWLFYSFGNGIFKRTSPWLAAFALGIVSMFIQSMITQSASTSQLVSTMDTNSFSSLFGTVARLFLPFLICSFFAPLAGRRGAG